MAAPQPDAAASFAPHRAGLLRLAYRMLGVHADAEDAVQDAFLRWAAADRAQVRAPAAFLRRTVTRLCLDQLKSARARRETYVGPWLPEPLVQHEGEAIDEVTLPLLLALERLSPLERAAFLLHDVFDADFDEVAAAIGRAPAACRQLAARARAHVREARPRYPVARGEGLAFARAFFTASRGGDLDRLRGLLAEGVSLHSDGGGKRPAALRVLAGVEEVMTVHAALARRFAQAPTRLVSYGFVNGLPGFVSLEADGPQTTALELDGGRIRAIYVVRNPDKLGRLPQAARLH